MMFQLNPDKFKTHIRRNMTVRITMAVKIEKSYNQCFGAILYLQKGKQYGHET
jgi:hypothetical protein